MCRAMSKPTSSPLLPRLLLRLSGVLDRLLRANGGVVPLLDPGRAGQRAEVALRYFSWRKLINILLIEAELKLTRKRVRGKPYEWEVDTTNICQLKCPLCHTGLGNIHRDKGVMSFETYRKTVDEIRNYCVWLTLYSWGEPFLNKDIDEYIAYAHRARLATIISTNLNKPLTPEMAEAVVRSGLDTMIVSLDGVTQEVYEQYRVAGRLDRVLDNLRLLVETKRRLGVETPYLEWQFIVMKQNEHQIEAARVVAEEIGVNDIIFKKVDFPWGMDDPALAEKWVPAGDSRYIREAAFDRPYKEDGAACWRLWRSAVVNWDGGVAPCCYLTDKEQDFGDVGEHSIRDIWNNERYTAARALFKGEAPEERVGCLDCSVFLSSPHGARWAARSRVNGTAPHRVELPVLNGAGVPKSAREGELVKRG